jgi:3'-phosphoadenosine 5'-phosphosulfate sulfotransferase (PAPS reductase)/FAD synthetase
VVSGVAAAAVGYLCRLCRADGFREMVVGMRVLSWFSCGAASAVAAKLALNKYKDAEVVVVNCDTKRNEHPDNYRFSREVSEWLGVPIQELRSNRYETVEDVFEQRRYMSGMKGAPCTVELKKVPRFEYQQPDDVHVFGYTVDEGKRIAKFEANNPELHLSWPLFDQGYTKKDCFKVLNAVGIRLPVMYELGFKNNNCIGCVKASAPKYWNMIRDNFPGTFSRRAEQSREIGCKLTRKKVNGKWEHIYLDELPIDAMDDFKEDLSCGPECRG